jgi:6,7-dimethyl-8-ribityllumazine synthase
MAKEAPLEFELTLPDRPRFAIVASRYNPRFVEGLVTSAREELRAASGQARVELIEVPGAFEIPVAAAAAARSRRFLAVLALGVIIQGRTRHANLIADGIVQGLMQISLETGVPVINEVLLLDDEEQARERTLGTKLNRGTEAAQAALHVVSSLRQFQMNPGTNG